MSYLEVKNVNKYYGKFHALKNISLSIEKGEFISFLGPSGCGKTTLLRVISGLEELNSGNLFLKGKDISSLHPSKRNFSIVFQSYALFPNMTTWENIAYGLKNKKMPKDLIEKKVKSVLEMVGLFSISNKYPNEMSGGQQQRVALARAVALEPDILLLDEPLSALDAKVREKLRNDIKSLQKRLGLTTIMVTHDQEEALSMSDKIMVMKDGEIMQWGNPREIYENPNSFFTADFIGKINFLENGKAIRPEHVKIVSDVLSNKNKFIMREIESWEYLGPSYRLFFKNRDRILKVEVPCNFINEQTLKQGNKFFLEFDESFYLDFRDEVS